MYLHLPNGFRSFVLGYGIKNSYDNTIHFQTNGGSFTLKLRALTSEIFIRMLDDGRINCIDSQFGDVSLH